ncbi:hypothetical protein AAZX31_16G082100 [Glycine max]|uniref:Uncharacterized protein n=2 Tax=Glycine subgen. Soja TaxID=1462606 RepID=I1MMA1_SOYBN|nr:uncharacterized protein LOC100805855 [Glycine max]XP_028206242.1 uncharacterized protein LOC114389699 [Glycine soja]KAG4938681.1 hypothetical protein JHK86_044822 [Glycine max]KAH1150597.1 hypothetical protein GYH30_044563 [Glycine max]KHN05767.1 hypothetical protein glysoja_049658 [Glycine soja]KRH07444.1 hypothetical protein GLYMA_16G089400v4 [Glycine max]|eukprot:XP_003547785.1 uncharacterized protein LOC100805855 [Glycine max]
MASHGCRRCPRHTDQPQQHCPHCPLRRHCSHCPLRRHCHHCPLHNPHFHAVNFIKPQTQPYFPPLPHFAPSPLKTHPNFESLHHNEQPFSSDARISLELEHIVLDGEEEEDEPVFVLTDEWREFFAQSEARRKLEKKQGKKGKK